jgi:hypothetical protein
VSARPTKTDPNLIAVDEAEVGDPETRAAAAVAAVAVAIAEVAEARPNETTCRAMRNWPRKRPRSMR